MGRNNEIRREIIDSKSPLAKHGLGKSLKFSVDGAKRLKMNSEIPPGREARTIGEIVFWEREK